MKHTITNLDSNQVLRYAYDEDAQALRIKSDFNLTGDIPVTMNMPEINFPKFPEFVQVPQIVKETELKVVQVPVYVPQIEYREVPVTVKETEIKVIEVPKIVIQKELEIREVPTIVREPQTTSVGEYLYRVLLLSLLAAIAAGQYI